MPIIFGNSNIIFQFLWVIYDDERILFSSSGTFFCLEENIFIFTMVYEGISRPFGLMKESVGFFLHFSSEPIIYGTREARTEVRHGSQG